MSACYCQQSMYKNRYIRTLISHFFYKQDMQKFLQFIFALSEDSVQTAHIYSDLIKVFIVYSMDN